MEISLPAAALSRELNLMQGVVEKRTTHQILTNVLLETREDRLLLSATDLETTMLSEVGPVTVHKPGSVTAPARRLFELVKDLPDEAEVRLSVLPNNHVLLECSQPRLRVRLNGLPAVDFPTRPEEGKGPSVEMPFGTLRRMVEKVRFAVSTEEMRLQLQGALLKAKGGGLEMAATDGHRLALVEVSEAKVDDSFEPVLVSKKVLDELGKLNAKDDATVTLVRGENQLCFVLGNRRLFARLDERRFPDYEKVIGRDNNKKAVVDRMDLLGAIRRISLLSGDRAKAVTLTFQPGAVVIASESQDVGDGSQEVPADYTEGVVTLRLNARYLEQFLDAAETPKIFLFVKDDQSQCQGRPGQEITGLKSYLYVVMPMRV